jgi:hypothetical protein
LLQRSKRRLGTAQVSRLQRLLERVEVLLDGAGPLRISAVVVMMVVLRSRLLQPLLERGKVLLCPAKIAILQILRAEGLLDGVGAVRTGAAWSRLRRRESRRESSEVLLGLGEISRLQILTQLRELVLDLLDCAVLAALALGTLALTILRFEKFKKVVARNS